VEAVNPPRGETSRNVVVDQFAQANNRLLAGDEAEQTKLHRIAKVHNLLKMWQSSHNLRAARKESRTLNHQMTAVRYISDTKDTVRACWAIFQKHRAATF
jgi:hypothetical protein